MGRLVKPVKMPAAKYSFSEEAKVRLVEDARALGWVTARSKNSSYGLSDYLNSIIRCQFVDQRPPEISALDEEIIANNFLPLWNQEYTRKRWLLRLTPRAKIVYFKLAIDYVIGNPRRFNAMDTPASAIGPVLEAIGLHWLVPVNPPHAPVALTLQKLERRRINAEAARNFYQSSY